MARGMPILRQYDVCELRHQPADDRHDSVAIGHGERAPWTEIILHIDDQQHIFVRAYLHPDPVRLKS
jgi:hypothetical protein